MIKILEGFPDNVIAASAVGRVTRQNYEEVLIPRLRRSPRSIRRFGVIMYWRGLQRHGVRNGVGGLQGWGEYWTRWEGSAWPS